MHRRDTARLTAAAALTGAHRLDAAPLTAAAALAGRLVADEVERCENPGIAAR